MFIFREIIASSKRKQIAKNVAKFGFEQSDCRVILLFTTEHPYLYMYRRQPSVTLRLPSSAVDKSSIHWTTKATDKHAQPEHVIFHYGADFE